MFFLTGLIIILLLFAVATTTVMPLASYALTLHKPIDCTVGETCFIQNYVDLDAGDQWHDYTCGPLSYNKHTGTDFRLKNLAQMRAGVNVLAAAEGKVLGVRDGMPDQNIREGGLDAIQDRECGNGVVLEHKGKYQTQYCHMQLGSITVKEGDRVKQGHPLGKVGLSGQTEFPHLHLVLRDKDGRVIDPFIGYTDTAKCNGDITSFWHTSVRQELQYLPTGVLNAGFTATAPQADAVREDPAAYDTLPATADTLIFWVDAFGLRDGDELIMTFKDPDGTPFVNHSRAIEGHKATFFQYIGKRLREDQWREGLYTGHYMIIRGEDENKQVIIDKSFTLTVGNPSRPQPL